MAKSTGIWTRDVSESFYGNVNALSRKLKAQESPRNPEDYQKTAPKRKDSSDYVLAYEEELHLADNFAFLAHALESVECVSAATIEEVMDPPNFTVRLASNHTPKPFVVDRLQRIVSLVRDHAELGEWSHHVPDATDLSVL